MSQARYEQRGDVAVITMDNPPVNGLGYELRKGIMEGLRRAFADDSVKAIVLTGAGKAFSGGADIREFNSPKVNAEPNLHTVIRAIEAAAKPVVAAIHSVAMGGGLELALGCHFRVAAPGAQIALPEVKLGLLPGGGGTQRLPRLIGPGRAFELVLSGRPVKAEEAAQIGLVNRVVPLADLLPEAIKLATTITANGPLAVAAAMECIVRGMNLSLDQGLRFESGRFGILAASEDMHEGLQAFLDKRPANFQRK